MNNPGRTDTLSADSRRRARPASASPVSAGPFSVAILCGSLIFALPGPAYPQDEQTPVAAPSYAETEIGRVLLKELKTRRTALEQLFSRRGSLLVLEHEQSVLTQQLKRMQIEEEIAELQEKLALSGMSDDTGLQSPVNPVQRILTLTGQQQEQARATVELKTEAGNRKNIELRVGSTVQYGGDEWLVIRMNTAEGITFIHAPTNTLQTFTLSDQS